MLDINESKNLTEEEKQNYYINLAKEVISQKKTELNRTMTACVTTFGCQMNARDSEKLAGILREIGYEIVEDEHADFVVFNTCTVRENANSKVYGRLGLLNSYKKKNPAMKIAICGCMMQEKDEVEKVKKTYRFVDMVFGTHNLYKFAELFYAMISEDKRVIEVLESSDEIVEHVPRERKFSFKSGVNISFGCNNFCTYCIVPYVRGREKSRNPKDIIKEIEDLVQDGVIEVMLLGQNVNSYGKTLEPKVTFAELLRDIEKIDGLKRIRFMTSHPKDLSDELIDVIASSDKISKHLHLPLQSGSSAILKKMNRVYSKEDYLALVDRIKAKIPDISLTTDIIVGFPGETEEDFLETMDVVEKVRYDSAFTFIYSKRTGTPAASFDNQVDEDVVKDRFDRLLAKVQEISREQVSRFEGHTEYALVEEMNSQDETLVSARLLNNIIVHFPGTKEDIGKIIPVKLTKCMGFYYYGEAIR